MLIILFIIILTFKKLKPNIVLIKHKKQKLNNKFTIMMVFIIFLINILKGNLLNHPSLVSSYLFELIGFQASGTNCTRFIIACSTQYDLKHSLELISGLIMKLRQQQQQQQIKPQSVQQGLVRQASSGSASKQHVLSSDLCTYSLTP